MNDFGKYMIAARAYWQERLETIQADTPTPTRERLIIRLREHIESIAAAIARTINPEEKHQ